MPPGPLPVVFVGTAAVKAVRRIFLRLGQASSVLRWAALCSLTFVRMEQLSEQELTSRRKMTVEAAERDVSSAACGWTD
eukprot:3408431-Rhodomonas_salina.2